MSVAGSNQGGSPKGRNKVKTNSWRVAGTGNCRNWQIDPEQVRCRKKRLESPDSKAKNNLEVER